MPWRPPGAGGVPTPRQAGQRVRVGQAYRSATTRAPHAVDRVDGWAWAIPSGPARQREAVMLPTDRPSTAIDRFGIRAVP